MHDAILVLEGPAVSLAPGSAAGARAWVVSPDELPRAGVEEGTVVTLLERDRIVGRAEVRGVRSDPTPQPLRDLAAAKTRPLDA